MWTYRRQTNVCKFIIYSYSKFSIQFHSDQIHFISFQLTQGNRNLQTYWTSFWRLCLCLAADHWAGYGFWRERVVLASWTSARSGAWSWARSGAWSWSWSGLSAAWPWCKTKHMWICPPLQNTAGQLVKVRGRHFGHFRVPHRTSCEMGHLSAINTRVFLENDRNWKFSN